MNGKLPILIAAALALFVSNCEKIQSYPPVPHIQYLSCSLTDTVDILSNKVKVLSVNFSFEDGDGDLFRDTTIEDSLCKIYYTVFQQKNGSKVPMTNSSLPPYYNFPWDPLMERTGQNKLQKGTMTFNYSFNLPFPVDTVNLVFFITDGSNHKSNIVEVPVNIILK